MSLPSSRGRLFDEDGGGGSSAEDVTPFMLSDQSNVRSSNEYLVGMRARKVGVCVCDRYERDLCVCVVVVGRVQTRELWGT